MTFMTDMTRPPISFRYTRVRYMCKEIEQSVISVIPAIETFCKLAKRG